MRSARLCAPCLALAFVALTLTGCGSLIRSRVKTSRGELSAPVQVAEPAKMSTVTTRSAVKLPAGTVVEMKKPCETAPGAVQAAPIQLRATLTDESEWVTETTAENAQSAHTPPPSPAAAAQAFGVRLFWIASLGCLAGAGVLAWMRHMLAAGCLALAAVAMPILAAVLSSHAAQIVAVCLVALGAGLVAAWYILNRKFAFERSHNAGAGQPVQV